MNTSLLYRLLPAICIAVLLSACQPDSALPLTGTLERDRIALVAEAQEPIVEIAIHEGEKVTAGQLIMRLDDSTAKADLAEAQAARNAAVAYLDELTKGPRYQAIQAARARLQGAEGVLANADKTYKRDQALVRQGVRSAAVLDQARANLDAAKGERDAARAQLKLLLEGTRSEQLRQAQASLESAEAKLRLIQIHINRLSVRAPRAGTVDALPYHRGDRPPLHATVAVLLADQHPYARVYIPEPLRTRIRAGDAAVIHIDGSDRGYPGKVRFVSSEAVFTPYYALTERDRGRLAYLAKIDLTGPDAGNLPSGIPVTVDFPGTRH